MASSASIPVDHTVGFSAASTARIVRWVAGREIAEQIASLRFAVITGLVLLLTPLAVYVGTRDYTGRLADYGRLQAEKQKALSGQAGKKVEGFDSPFSPINELVVLRAIRAPEPESVLVRGLDSVRPQYWDFTPAGTVAGPPASTARRLADLLGQLDFEFLVRVTLGLLAILLAFDAIAGEKELGTLRAVLSQPVSRAAILVGKLMGGAVTLIVPLAMALLIALLSSQLFGVDLVAAGSLPKVAMLGVTAAAYLICSYSLGLLVSSLVASQKTSLVVLLVIWVVTVLAAPPTATLVAQAISPVPLPQALESRKQALDEDIRKDTEVAMGKIYSEITHLPKGWADTSKYIENKAAIDAQIVPLEVNYLNRRRQTLGEIDRDAERMASRQNTLARAILLLSPAAAFATAASDLAGTGDSENNEWKEAMRLHKSKLDSLLFENPPMVTIRTGGSTFEAEIRKPPSAADLPAFTPPRRDAASAFNRALPSFGLLAAFSGLFIAGSFLAFSRYDVR